MEMCMIKVSHYLAGVGVLASILLMTKVPVGYAEERAGVVSAAPATDTRQKEILAFLQEYFSALAQGEVTKLAYYHPALTAEQLEVLRAYFANTVQDLSIQLRNVEVRIAANTATIGFSRTDRFIDRPTGRAVEKSIELSTMLVHRAQGWQLAGLDQVAFALASAHSRTS